VHAAFKELLECRSVLQHSYAFSFYKFQHLSSKKYRHVKRLWNEKAAFEQMQSELEIITEQMSDIVARSHLRATQTQILFLTVGASERRTEFSNLIFTLMNEEKKRKRDGTSDKKRRSTRATEAAPPASAVGNVGELEGMAGSTFVVQAIAPAAQVGDEGEGEDDTERPQNEDQETVREALHASLEAFMANTDEQPTFVAHVDIDSDSDGLDGEDDEGRFNSWACSACTYMNSGGRHCAMCGTPVGT
jgi:hypothetical protein